MLTVLDLFSGIGGFSLGLERTGGFRTVAFCEIEPYCRAVLGKHWPGVPCFPDVRVLDADMLDIVGVDRPDVICGGFPCQDISLAGKGAGLAGERSGLWVEYHRLIAELRPAYAIIENVSALRSRGLEDVLGSLAAIGYDAEWHCIPAAAVGAPHRRDRVWIVAHSNRQGEHDGAVDAEVGGPSEPLADASRNVLAEQTQSRAERQRVGQCGTESGAGDVADTLCTRLESTGDRSGPRCLRAARLLTAVARGGWWESEPDVGRVAHGVPARVDRLRSLGNAVVPQIPQIIGEAILRAEGLR